MANPGDVIDIPTQSTGQANSYNAFTGYSPQNELASFVGLGVPVRFVLASDDTTIPPSQADYFLANVGDPNYSLRPGGKVTGGHTGLFQNVPFQETVAWFSTFANSGAWTTYLGMHASKTLADLRATYPTVAALAASGKRLVSV